MSNSITIPKNQLENMGGVVILPAHEYRRLVEQSISTYYLNGKAAKETDALVENGLREYQQGKTRRIKTLADLD